MSDNVKQPSDLGGPELYQVLKESLGLPDWVRSFSLHADVQGPVIVSAEWYAHKDGFGKLGPFMARFKFLEIGDPSLGGPPAMRTGSDGAPTWDG